MWLVHDTPLLDAQGSQIMQTELVSEKVQHRMF
jgi:hypothetical protein